MFHNVYLQGELGERFGHKFRVHSDSYRDILRCIEANRPDFKSYLIECQEKDIGFSLKREGEEVGEEDLLAPVKEGDITLAIVPAGSKKGLKKILAAVLLVYIMIQMPTVFAKAGEVAGSTAMEHAFKHGLSTAGKVGAAVATSLAVTGLAELMAPDANLDGDTPTNYLFNGDAQVMQDGDPVPVLYGELRVPGTPIAVNVLNGMKLNAQSIVEADGSISVVSAAEEEY